MTADTAVLPALTVPPQALPRRGWFRRLGVDTGYTLVAFPLSIVSFVVVTGLALGAGPLVVWAGVAVLAAALVAARGLAAAERATRGAPRALAARSPIPVELDLELPGERLTPVTENTAYFVVREALANIAEHSDAAGCRVSLILDGDRLRVVVEEDGRGGAVLAPGHGLAGLADRLRAVDGVLTVDSARGGRRG